MCFVMKIAFAALVSFLSLTCPAASWEFLNIEGKGVGTLNACAAIKEYTDSFVTIRLYGDEMDLLFQHQSFAMPYDTVLGPVRLAINDTTFVSVATSFAKNQRDTSATTSVMQLDLRKQDYGPLFDKLRNGSRLVLTFPNGDTYAVPLSGSARALNAASDCWRAKQTGPDEKNPFAAPQQQDPFQAPAGMPANPFDIPA